MTVWSAPLALLRRVRVGIFRVALLRLLGAADYDKVGLVRLGSEYGGWWVPVDALTPGAVAYCGGVGEDITFEEELLERDLKVRSFDPTPRSIAFVDERRVDGDFRFLPVGWWDEQTELRFYAPRDPSHVSHSATNVQQTHDSFVAPVDTVASLAEILGDSRVDILKMDVEGAELRVIRSLLRHGPRPRVLCVEFHLPQPLGPAIAALRELRSGGYRIARFEGKGDVTLVRCDRGGSKQGPPD